MVYRYNYYSCCCFCCHYCCHHHYYYYYYYYYYCYYCYCCWQCWIVIDVHVSAYCYPNRNHLKKKKKTIMLEIRGWYKQKTRHLTWTLGCDGCYLEDLAMLAIPSLKATFCFWIITMVFVLTVSVFSNREACCVSMKLKLPMLPKHQMILQMINSCHYCFPLHYFQIQQADCECH